MNAALPSNTELLACRRCPRLAGQFRRLRDSHPTYWNRPVPASGNPRAQLLIVGLAPGMHGANKTGQPFAGDASGDLLHQVLAETGLTDKVRVTNAVKCLPIKNLPNGSEVRNCTRFLAPELEASPKAVLALGGVAHRAIISALGYRQAAYPFGHGAVHRLPNLTLIDSYHCSRYNTQTGRLTHSMFHEVVEISADIAHAR